MTGRHKPDGKISKYNEVKGVALNLKRSPENAEIWGVSRSYRYGRRRCGRCATDECRPSPRGLRQHRVTQRQASNQASDEQGLLGNRAMQYPSMGLNVKREVQKAASRVMGAGRPQRLAMKRGNALGAKVPTVC